MARTGKYKEWQQPENLILIQGWRRDGLSDEQIAHNIGIARGTLYDWIKKYSDIANAYKKGTEVSTYEIENALYKSALGHFVEEEEIIKTENELGTTTTKKKHRRYIPPNTAAQIFILKNRLHMKWRDKPEIIDVEATVDDGFIKALEDKAGEDWTEDGDSE